jgi:hypothetical protein
MKKMARTYYGTKNKLSPIEYIHSQGLIAVIDGDRNLIVKTVTAEQVERTIKELELIYKDVAQDKDGDIVFYSEL